MTQVAEFDASRAIMRQPTDERILKAVGLVAIAHGHLEYILRMTVRTLTGMTVSDALDATQYASMRELRDNVKKLFRKKTEDAELRLRMNALLRQAERLTEKRNKLIHRTWGESPDGQLLIKGDDHVFGPPPTPAELETLTDEIYALIRQINHERMSGFINEAVTQASNI